MSNDVAPSCPISNSQPTQKPYQPPGASANGAQIPPAHDLRTVINAINAMNFVVNQITRGAPQVNNVYPPTEAGIPAPQQEPPPQYERLTWHERNRGYVMQQVINPDDPEQFVEINTLSFVHWIEEATGHNLVYQGS